MITLTKNSNFLAQGNATYFVTASLTCTLPTAVGKTGQSITVINNGPANTAITFNTTLNQTINGLASGVLQSVNQFDQYVFTSNGTAWTGQLSLQAQTVKPFTVFGNQTQTNNTLGYKIVPPQAGGTGLTSIGQPSSLLGTNVSGSGLEYKVLEASGGLLINSQAGKITFSIPSFGTVSSIKVQGDGVLFPTVLAGSPITTSGTIQLALAPQAQNTVFAGPLDEDGYPNFRVLTAADLPPISLTSETITDILQTINGGLGLASAPAINQMLIGDGSGDYKLATLTAGVGITLNTSGDTILIGAPGAGSVSSVSFTGDGVFLSSTPTGSITSTGTLTATTANAPAGSWLGNTGGSAAAPSYHTSALPTSMGGTGLNSNGTAGYVLAANTSGNGLEYKHVTGSGGVTISMTSGVFNIDGSGSGGASTTATYLTAANETSSLPDSVQFLGTMSGTDAIAIASGATASGNYALAIGQAADAGSNYTIAISNLASASGAYAIAIGASAGAGQTNSICIGASSGTAGTGCIAFGTSASAEGTDSIAIGHSTLARDNGDVIIGSGASGSSGGGVNRVALGYAAYTDADNSVALGYNSTTDGVSDVVSVGSVANSITRKITNVANGTNPNDAVNYSQISGISGGTPGGTSGEIQFNSSGSFGGFTISGDGTLNTSTGVLTVTKTNGTLFGTAAVKNLSSVIVDNGSGALTIGGAEVTGSMIASSVALAGSPTTTTQTSSDNSTKIATTAYVQSVVSGIGFTSPMTTLGDLLYENATPAAARLAGNTTTTPKYLRMVGTGSAAAAPTWGQPTFSELSGSATTGQMPANVAYTNNANSWSANQVPSSAGSQSLGTNTYPWSAVYVGSAGTDNNEITSATTTAARTFTLPDANSNPIQPLSSGTSHEWVSYIDSTGTQHLTRPAAADISGLGTAASENLSSVIIDNGSGALTIGSAQVTGSMIASSVALAGNPTTTTATGGDNSTKIATTAFVTSAISASGGGSVTSVSLTGDGTVYAAAAGTPVTTSGTLTLPTPKSQSSGTLFGVEGGTSASPTFFSPGTNDQILGVVHTGTGLEYKSVVAGAGITVTPSSGQIQISASTSSVPLGVVLACANGSFLFT